MPPVMTRELSLGERREQLFNTSSLMQRGISLIQEAVVGICAIPDGCQDLARWRIQRRRDSQASQNEC